MSRNWKVTLPRGYEIGEDGAVYRLRLLPGKKTVTEKITNGKCYVSALARSDDAEWYRIVVFVDYDGNRKEVIIPISAFTNRGTPVVQLLSDGGLSILPGKEKELVRYLHNFDSDNRVLLTKKTGMTDDLMNYVLSSRAILGPQQELQIKFQPEQHCPAEVAIRSAGTKADYEKRVLIPAKGNPLMIFAIIVGFVAPLQRFLIIDNGGVHFYGFTSRGKSLLLQLIASVFGFGADPNRARDTYIQRWSLTANAAEALAAAFSEKPLCLDELEAYVGNDLGGIIYILAGGKGKSAMNSARGLQENRSWNTFIASSGEKSLREMIRQSGGKAMEGQSVRFVEIAVGENIVLDAHGKTNSDFAESMKFACSECYGTAGPEFIKKFLADLADVPIGEVLATLREHHEKLLKELTVPGMRPEHLRALRRFAAAQLAGELAIEYGVLPFTEEEVKESVLFARDLWLREAGVANGIDIGLAALQAFIRDHMQSFPTTSDADADMTKAPGYRHPSRDVLLFSADQLQAASGGYDPLAIARELRDRSLLITHEPGRLTIKQPMAMNNNSKSNVYAVREQILREQFGPKTVDLTPFEDPKVLDCEY